MIAGNFWSAEEGSKNLSRSFICTTSTLHYPLKSFKPSRMLALLIEASLVGNHKTNINSRHQFYLMWVKPHFQQKTTQFAIMRNLSHLERFVLNGHCGCSNVATSSYFLIHDNKNHQERRTQLSGKAPATIFSALIILAKSSRRRDAKFQIECAAYLIFLAPHPHNRNQK